MMHWVLANGELLPETLEFLNTGWWIVHIVGTIFWLALGFVWGKKSAAKAASTPPAATAPAESEGGEAQ